MKSFKKSFRQSLTGKWSRGLLLTTSLVMTGTSSAAIVTLNGADVSFTFDDSTLFGTGMVVGNSLFFQPTAFYAQSLNGAGAAMTNQTLNITVNAITSGYNITSVAMAEQGDYIQDGADASVAAGGRLGVNSLTTNCGIFVCEDASLFNVAGFVDTGGILAGWSGGTSVDLADTAGWGMDTSLSVSFQNDLTATTLANGETAFIQKKSGAIGLLVNPVPVPAAVWLFGSGLIALLAASRRKRV